MIIRELIEWLCLCDLETRVWIHDACTNEDFNLDCVDFEHSIDGEISLNFNEKI